MLECIIIELALLFFSSPTLDQYKHGVKLKEKSFDRSFVKYSSSIRKHQDSLPTTTMAIAINSIASECKSGGTRMNAFDRAFLDECRRNSVAATCIERQRLLNSHHQHHQTLSRPPEPSDMTPEGVGVGSHSYVNSYIVHFQQQQIQHEQQQEVLKAMRHRDRYRHCAWTLILVVLLVCAIMAMIYFVPILPDLGVYNYLYIVVAIFVLVGIIIFVGRHIDRYEEQRRPSNSSGGSAAAAAGNTPPKKVAPASKATTANLSITASP